MVTLDAGKMKNYCTYMDEHYHEQLRLLGPLEEEDRALSESLPCPSGGRERTGPSMSPFPVSQGGGPGPQ